MKLSARLRLLWQQIWRQHQRYIVGDQAFGREKEDKGVVITYLARLDNIGHVCWHQQLSYKRAHPTVPFSSAHFSKKNLSSCWQLFFSNKYNCWIYNSVKMEPWLNEFEIVNMAFECKNEQIFGYRFALLHCNTDWSVNYRLDFVVHGNSRWLVMRSVSVYGGQSKLMW